MSIRSFVRELRRRRVLKVLGIYAVVSWIVIQVAATVFPYLMIPDWGVRLVIGLSFLGLPIAAVLAWAFEVTPDGVRRTESESIADRSAMRLGLITLAVVVVVGGLFGYRRWTRAAEEAAGTASIAVLPFVNMSGDRENEYFSDGMTEELLNELAQVPGLRVAARTSSFAFKGKNLAVEEIGERLGVSTVLEGSVRKSGGRIRITAQLIDAKTGYHLWSEEYDRELQDVFAVQGEISRTITSALESRFTAKMEGAGVASRPDSRQPTENLAAYEKYLRGKHMVENATADTEIASAVTLLREATTMDPGFALAFASLSDAYQSVPLTAESTRLARAAAQRALQLDPQLAEGYAALAGVEEQDWNWAEAETLYQKSIELNPTLAAACGCYGLELFILGRTGEGIRELERARMLDPMDAGHSAVLAAAYAGTGRTAEADAEARKALAVDPKNALARRVLAWNDVAAGRFDEALERLTGSDRPDTLDLKKLTPWIRAEIGYVYALSGRRADAQRVLKEMKAQYRETKVGAPLIASIYVGLGDEVTAMQWFERAFKAHEAVLPITTLLPQTQPLRDNPEYQAMLRRMGVRGS
jgi:TolB-like protein/tetratricopeptide (TPR) repeat protein